MAADVEADAAPLVSSSGLPREEVGEYLFGDPSPETLAKLRPVRLSELPRRVTDPTDT